MPKTSHYIVNIKMFFFHKEIYLSSLQLSVLLNEISISIQLDHLNIQLQQSNRE